MVRTLPQLNAVDIRSKLPRASWEIGRRSSTTSITVHYNGPAVPSSHQSGDGLLSQLKTDCAWQMQPGWGGSTNGADGLMYHLVIASDGIVYQARDLDALLWHCGHADGNTNGLAVHLPIGDSQMPSDVQWQATLKTIETLRRAFVLSVPRILGHIEWKHATQCPGPNIMQRLVAYRQGQSGIVTPTGGMGLVRYQVVNLAPGDTLNIREGRGTNYPIALGGIAKLKTGQVIWVDDVTAGWAHMALVPNEQSDLGFVSVAYLRRLD